VTKDDLKMNFENYFCLNFVKIRDCQKTPAENQIARNEFVPREQGA
jgi:hypothetical protein